MLKRRITRRRKRIITRKCIAYSSTVIFIYLITILILLKRQNLHNMMAESLLQYEAVSFITPDKNETQEIITNKVENIIMPLEVTGESKADPEKRDKIKECVNVIFDVTCSCKCDPKKSKKSFCMYSVKNVRQMFRHAWDNYVQYAWGTDELKPLSKTGGGASYFGFKSLGASLIDGMDTLYIMNYMEEFNRGKEWIEKSLNLNDVSSRLSAFEINIRLVGGLLSCYSLTGDVIFKEKAVQAADMILPVFDTPTGISLSLIIPNKKTCRNYMWAGRGCSILSETGSFHLEFSYLSDVTGNPIYREKVDRLRKYLDEKYKPDGLYCNFINQNTGICGQSHVSLGALGDSFYEYLLKSWLQSGRTDKNARRMFDKAMKPLLDKILKTSKSGLQYLGNIRSKALQHKMEHLACFTGGMFGLASRSLSNDHTQFYMEIAENLTNTCHESYIRSESGLGPDGFWFKNDVEAKGLGGSDNVYILRPETVESYFVLWRLTKNQKYRDWGWEVVQALEKHCRGKTGYSGLKNVYSATPGKDNTQQSYFLAETLKYLYLLFSDDSVLPLDQWVFNTEAHPLPIIRANSNYRKA